MILDSYQLDAMRKRFAERTEQRNRNKRLIDKKDYLNVDAPDRVAKFLSRRGISPTDAAASLAAGRAGGVHAPATAESVHNEAALERVLGTNDLMGVVFLERGLQVARTVGRIWMTVNAGRASGYGTGFLISPRLLMTNHHVLGDRVACRTSLVEFGYEVRANGVLGASTRFELDPDAFHCADQHLDYAVVAVKPQSSDGAHLGDLGWNQILEDEGKAIAAQWVNIIQHPNGEPKQLSLRQNQLVDVLPEFVHYMTDTTPGSSGAAVFNDRWEVVALHHSGVWETNKAGQIMAIDGSVWREEMGEERIKWIANEGARISKVIQHLRQQSLTPAQQAILNEALDVPPAKPAENVVPVEQPPRRASATPNAATIAANGTATWTIPLQLSVRIPGLGDAAQLHGAAAGGTPAASAVITSIDDAAVHANDNGLPSTNGSVSTLGAASSRNGSIQLSASEPEAIVAAAQRALGKRADVLNVRLGYVFKNGWITKDRAVVVTVRQKQTPKELRDARVSSLPETFGGLPVEVTNPQIEDLLRLASVPHVAEALLTQPDVLRNEIKYVSPKTPLTSIQQKMRVIAHLSPDAGWPQLKTFLAGVKSRLVLGIYDIGAPHVVAAIDAAAKRQGFKDFHLVLQHGESVGSGTKANDLTDEEVVDDFRKHFGKRFNSAWVKIGAVNGWVATSYHIKVAVRDTAAIWLSSGNLQSSNQPNIEPLKKPTDRSPLTTYNREWHAIVENKALAKTFEAYLLHDFKNNQAFHPGQEAMPDLLLPQSLFVPTVAERTQTFKYFPAFDENRVFSVQPVLTPDNYRDHVLKLVASAEEELSIQNQTFNAPGDGQDVLDELVGAVLARQKAGVNVRVIFRVLMASKARAVLEALQDYGFDMSCVRVQKNCHTKGIVVDRKRVLLGSQNWSNLGVTVNRDASLLFDDPKVASYFATAFDHDWENLARQDIGSEAHAVEWAPAGAATPAGMVRLSAKDYLEMA